LDGWKRTDTEKLIALDFDDLDAKGAHGRQPLKDVNDDRWESEVTLSPETTVQGLQTTTRMRTAHIAIYRKGETVPRYNLDVPLTELLSQRYKELKELIEKLDSRVTVAEKNITNLDTRVTTLESKVGGLESDVSGLNGAVSGLSSSVSGLNGSVSGLDGRVKNLENNSSSGSSGGSSESSGGLMVTSVRMYSKHSSSSGGGGSQVIEMCFNQKVYYNDNCLKWFTGVHF